MSETAATPWFAALTMALCDMQTSAVLSPSERRAASLGYATERTVSAVARDIAAARRVRERAA